MYGMENRTVTFKNMQEVTKKMEEIEEFFSRDISEEVVEDWLDSEYHRIFVTYVYPDLTKVM
jgi:hypothetical protein